MTPTRTTSRRVGETLFVVQHLRAGYGMYC
jgi:hypothetical protein